MRQRNTIKKHVRTRKEMYIWYGLGVLFCIYFGFLCGAVWTEDVNLFDYVDNFQIFIIEEQHFIVGVTSATPKFVLAYVTIFTLAYIMHCTKIEHPYAGEEYGTAKWGDAREFTNEYANHDSRNEVEVVTGDVTLMHPLKVNTANYWLAEDVYLSINNEKTSNLNMLVVGPPGSGKSFRLARPMLSQLCGNFLVTDPKGELYKQTGQYFEDNGYEVMVMNVESEEGMPMSIHFNPFEYIRNESDIMSIAGILMKATTPQDDAGGGNDQFFEQSAEVLLTSLIYLIHYYYPKEKQNWKTFVELLDATTVYTNKDGSIDNRQGGIMKIMEKAQREWKAKHDTDFPGYVAVEKYYNGAAETTSSIVASLDAHCRYMKLSCVIDLLSEDEIHIGESFGYSKPRRDCRTGKRILFIVTSEDKRYYDWIPSMVYSLFFDELYHLTAIDPSLHETLPQHLTFLMDEFANVTLPDSFVEKLSTMRSRNMSAVIIVQNLIQLKRKFPKFDMDKDLIGNCSIIDILGAPDMDSCEYLSKHFGTQTIHKASESNAIDMKGSSSRSEDVMEKSLLSAEDIFAMKKDGECAIVIKGSNPLYQQKCQMEKTDFVKLLCRKHNPYDPKKRRNRKAGANNHIKNENVLPGFELTSILINKDARNEADRLRSEGRKVIKMNEYDLKGFIKAMEIGMDAEPEPMSADMRKRVEENYRQYREKLKSEKAIDMSMFWNEDAVDKEEENLKYKKRVMLVRKLITAGYSNSQIRAMKQLIMAGYEIDELKEMFSVNVKLSEINQVAELV